MQIFEEFDHPAFKLVIIYEDSAAIEHALAFQEFLMQSCLNGFDVTRRAWNFAYLSHPRLREQAAQEAGEADMLVVAAGVGAVLPEYVRSWMVGFRPYKQDFRPAMVALLNRENRFQAKSESLIEWLRQTAEENGMDFFCKQTPDVHFSEVCSSVDSAGIRAKFPTARLISPTSFT